MKKFRLIFLAVIAFGSFVHAQKIGVVDTDYILNKLPQYQEAQTRLNVQISNWQSEIQALQTELDKKKLALENERVLLVGEQLKSRQKEVDDLDQKIKSMINNRFGAAGEINSARSSLTRPFQDLIWGAIKTVSEKNSLGIVLDKSNNISVIFLDKKYDYTDKVLDVLMKNSGNFKKETRLQTPRDPMIEREEKMKQINNRDESNLPQKSRSKSQ